MRLKDFEKVSAKNAVSVCPGRYIQINPDGSSCTTDDVLNRDLNTAHAALKLFVRKLDSCKRSLEILAAEDDFESVSDLLPATALTL